MSNATLKYKVEACVLVRDKDGRPKISDPALIDMFRHALTEDDLKYLEEKFNGNTDARNSST